MNEPIYAPIVDPAAAVSWMADELDALKAKYDKLASRHDRLKTALQTVVAYYDEAGDNDSPCEIPSLEMVRVAEAALEKDKEDAEKGRDA